MFLWLIHQFADRRWLLAFGLSEDSPDYPAVRVVAAAASAFVLTLALGPLSIRLLRSRFRERIASDSARLNELHSAKQGTPTMGGLFVMLSVLIAMLLWGDLSSRQLWLGSFLLVSLTATGAIDDWIKLRTSRKGLTARQKLAAQLVIAALTALGLYYEHARLPGGVAITLPFGWAPLHPGPLYIVWATFVMVAGSNAVNLTDGLDGLAAGCTAIAGIAFALLMFLSGQLVPLALVQTPLVAGSGEFSVLIAALAASMLGFLWFNCYPAQVFMGDAGALPAGGLLSLAALIGHQEFLLVVIGGVFVAETLSVILQVSWFRMTGGRRLIRCSPLHNHFLIAGEHEVRIVVRFWIMAAFLALTGLASLLINS